MADINERKEIKIFLPLYLIDLFKSQAEYTGRSFNDELVDVLEKAIFLNPNDLNLVKETAEAKAELKAIREASMEESATLLQKIRERKHIIDDISTLKPTEK